jgi:hypothetical protein
MAINYSTLPGQVGVAMQIARMYAAQVYNHLQSAASPNIAYILNAVLSQSITEQKNMYASETAFATVNGVSTFQSLFKSYRNQISSGGDLFGIIAVGLGLGSADFRSQPILYQYDQTLTDGTINIVGTLGVLGLLNTDMILNGQYVTPCTMTPGSLTAISGNRGLINLTSLTALSQVPTGTYWFVCTNEIVNACTFQVTEKLPLTVPLADGINVIFADNPLTAEKTFNDGSTGLRNVVLTRPGLASPALANNGSSAIFSSVSFVNAQEGDMNRGVLYVRVTRQATAGQEWLLEFFNNSSLTVKQGATVIGGTSGTTVISNFVLRSGTVITFTFSNTNANTDLPSSTNTITVTMSINTPRLGDTWTLSIVNGYDGNFSAKIGSLFRWTPPTTGANHWTDSLAASLSVT